MKPAFVANMVRLEPGAYAEGSTLVFVATLFLLAVISGVGAHEDGSASQQLQLKGLSPSKTKKLTGVWAIVSREVTLPNKTKIERAVVDGERSFLIVTPKLFVSVISDFPTPAAYAGPSILKEHLLLTTAKAIVPLLPTMLGQPLPLQIASITSSKLRTFRPDVPDVVGTWEKIEQVY